MPLPRPSSNLDWTVGNPNFGTVTVEPVSGKKITGWTPGEPPPNQIMNWLFYNTDQWIKYLDSAISALSASLTTSVGRRVVLSGVIDGTNRVFNLPITPNDNGSVWLYVDGVEVSPSKYSVSDTTVTFSPGSQPTDPAQTVEADVLIQVSGVGGGGGGGFLPMVFGTLLAPIVVDPTVALAPSIDAVQYYFIVSTGGFQPVTANPQIAPGTSVGQQIILQGDSDTNYVQYNDGNGLALNGAINLKNKETIRLIWDGEVWNEEGSRK